MPHDTIDRPHSSATEQAAQRRHNDHATTPQSLIDELEDAIANKDLHHRAAVLRRITDLFVTNGSGFSAEQIAMFDDVMSRLVVAIDSLARAEFGAVIAKHPNAPPHTSRILALDDAIEVAGPLLSQSNKLDEATLVEGAKTKSQEHLYAISLRDSIGEAVTDVLVARGNTEVVKSTAANLGAKFSEFGCATLATRSADDSELALQVWSRDDIPRQHLLSLFATASEAVQKQLAAADRKKAELYRYVIAQANSQIQTKMRESSTRYAAARPYIESLYQSGTLTGERVAEFARADNFDEVAIALSLLCALPVGHIERAIVHNQADHLLVLAKAIGLSWEATKAILLMRRPGKHAAAIELEVARASFAKLQPKTAVSAMQFYRLRVRSEAQLESN